MQQHIVHIGAAVSGDGHVGEERQPRSDVGGRRRHACRRNKQRFFARRLHTVSRQSVEAGQRRAGRKGQRVQLFGA